MFLPSMVLAAYVAVQSPAVPTIYPLVSLQDHLPPINEYRRVDAAKASDFVQNGGEDIFQHTRPNVVMMAKQDMNSVSVSVAFNWIWLGDEDRKPVWFARLRAANYDRSIERFADSRDCPAVEQALAQLNDLPDIAPRIPSLPNPEGAGLGDEGGYLHDNMYRIRLRGLFDGAAYTDGLELTGGSTTPFATVVVESLTRLLPCWVETAPPLR